VAGFLVVVAAASESGAADPGATDLRIEKLHERWEAALESGDEAARERIGRRLLARYHRARSRGEVLDGRSVAAAAQVAFPEFEARLADYRALALPDTWDSRELKPVYRAKIRVALDIRAAAIRFMADYPDYDHVLGCLFLDGELLWEFAGMIYAWDPPFPEVDGDFPAPDELAEPFEVAAVAMYERVLVVAAESTRHSPWLERAQARLHEADPSIYPLPKPWRVPVDSGGPFLPSGFLPPHPTKAGPDEAESVGGVEAPDPAAPLLDTAEFLAAMDTALGESLSLNALTEVVFSSEEDLATLPVRRAADADGAALLGTEYYGLYLDWVATALVERVVEQGDDGNFQVTSTVTSLVEDTWIQEVTRLDPTFALLSREVEDRGSFHGTPLYGSARTERRGDLWISEVSGPGRDKTGAIAYTGPCFDPTASVQLLARMVDLETPARYPLQIVAWGGVTGRLLGVEEAQLVVGERTEMEFRGTITPVIPVRFEQGETASVVAVSDDHRILAFWLDDPLVAGMPIQGLAGTREQCSQDLPHPAEGPREVAVKEAALDLLRMFAGFAESIDLDRRIDWAALQACLTERRPDLAEVDPDHFRALAGPAILHGIGGAGISTSPEGLALGVQVMRAEVDGDVARLTTPGIEGFAIGFEEQQGTWRMVSVELPIGPPEPAE